ncbi:MAG: nucleoside diphosphate kinase regulator [Geminicoccaceae bacterium]
MHELNRFPPIVLTTEDYERLARLATAAARSMPDVADYLAEELERADVVDPDGIAPTVATMNSKVVYRDEQSRQTRSVTLVYPGEHDLAAGRLSVLTPVGAALIGLAEGQSICWYPPNGAARVVTLIGVEARSEPAAKVSLQGA